MNEIVSNLYVGNIIDAEDFPGFVLCVLEGCTAPRVLSIPFLKPTASSYEADLRKLDAIADIIEAARENGNRVLVHCGAGIERSPLAVAWYLHRKKGMSLDRAYTVIREKRPEVESRLEWLPLTPEATPATEGKGDGRD